MTTLTGRDGERWAVYPLAWCPRCRRETPHAGPCCQVNDCGVPNDGEPGMSRYTPEESLCSFPRCKQPPEIGIERMGSGDRWLPPIWYCDRHATLIVARFPTTARRFGRIGDPR
jgi:hypothetical protein